MSHIIRITYTDNTEIITRINGTEQEVYNHYRENNFFTSCNNINCQAKRIEFIDSPLIGTKCKSLVYLFMDYGNGYLE